MTQIFKNQPQRVPIGSFLSPQGNEVQVFITQPWFKAFDALSKVDVSGGGGGGGAVNFDDLPAFEYGDLVFASSDSTIQRLPSVQAGNVFYDGGPGNAPVSGPLPTATSVTPRQITQYVALRAF